MTDQEKNEMFLRNEKLIYWYLEKHKLLFMIDELYDIACIALASGINNFDKSMGIRETTFFVKCISIALLNIFNFKIFLREN